MRVVLDVNVWISALLWRGVPRQVVDLAVNQQITIFASEVLFAELEITLKRAKFQKQIMSIPTTVDDLIDAEAIITGDNDLLILTEFAGIPILTPQNFLELYFPNS